MFDNFILRIKTQLNLIRPIMNHKMLRKNTVLMFWWIYHTNIKNLLHKNIYYK